MTKLLDKFRDRRQAVSDAARLDDMKVDHKKAAVKERISGKPKIADKFKNVSFSEIDRITGLDIDLGFDAAEIEEYSRAHIYTEAFDRGFRLFKEQAEALYAYEEINGLVAPIAVGRGKTLLSLMIAEIAYQKGFRKLMLNVRSDILDQLIGRDISFARGVTQISYPIHCMGGLNSKERRSLAKSDKRGLYIFPYSTLSTKDAEDCLFWISPQEITCDEAHALSHLDAARTQRFMRYVNQADPELCVMSGTLTKKSMRQYHHLAKQALKDFNPLPNGMNMANEWCSVIDADAGEPGGQATGPLKPLIWWAQENFPAEEFSEDRAGFRKAFKTRLNSSPGVVNSGADDLATSLTLTNVDLGEYVATAEGYDELTELIKTVEDEWVTPNGDEIEHAIHTFKWQYELTAGFYNELVWPTAEALAGRRNISVGESQELLADARVAHEAHQAYAKELRDWFGRHSKKGLDTPMLVGGSMHQHGAKHVGSTLFEAWEYWKGLQRDDLPERDKNAIRVCPYKIHAAADWAEKQDGGIIWGYHIDIVQWIYEELVSRGAPVMHCPAGQNAEILAMENRDKILCASMTAHSTGKNLQHHQNTFFLQWPRPADMAEQVLGRTHRTGQTADELRPVLCHGIEFDYINFAACLNDALYIHQTNQRQKLIYCNYDPLPKIFPWSVLKERGAQARRLSKEMQDQLDQIGGAA